MNKKDRAALVQKILQEHFPKPSIPLLHNNPFELLIAVLLSAQCTDERVNRITPRLFLKANTPEKMAALGPDEIQKIIRPCGLSQRKARAIWKLSEILRDKYQGQVPDTIEALEELPGVGHKTASVVMVQAFHEPAFPVDTHIHRLAKRWGLSSGKNVVQTERDLKRLFPQEAWEKLHHQMIYFGRAFCPARGHKKELCPICSIILR